MSIILRPGSRTKATGGDRTRDHTIKSRALYHWATAAKVVVTGNCFLYGQPDTGVLQRGIRTRPFWLEFGKKELLRRSTLSVCVLQKPLFITTSQMQTHSCVRRELNPQSCVKNTLDIAVWFLINSPSGAWTRDLGVPWNQCVMELLNSVSIVVNYKHRALTNWAMGPCCCRISKDSSK